MVQIPKSWLKRRKAGGRHSDALAIDPLIFIRNRWFAPKQRV